MRSRSHKHFVAVTQSRRATKRRIQNNSTDSCLFLGLLLPAPLAAFFFAALAFGAPVAFFTTFFLPEDLVAAFFFFFVGRKALIRAPTFFSASFARPLVISSRIASAARLTGFRPLADESPTMAPTAPPASANRPAHHASEDGPGYCPSRLLRNRHTNR